MLTQLQMFEGSSTVDVQNQVDEWINIEDTKGLNIVRTETACAYSGATQIIIVSVWYYTVINKGK